MTIKEMHYDFKKKLNKGDSQQNRNLLIPEIDWTLNEAVEIFVKLIAEPRLKSYMGFEKTQRNRDDIRTIVVNELPIAVVANISTLPTDYWHFIKGEVIITKQNCTGLKAKLNMPQHDDEFEDSPFHQSSFEWREVNGVFFENGVKFYNDGTFTIDSLTLSYIRRLAYIHNAEDFRVGGYNLPSGVALAGSVNCELPEHTHREIVDIAVLIASGEIESSAYQLKQAKLNLNKLNT